MKQETVILGKRVLFQLLYGRTKKQFQQFRQFMTIPLLKLKGPYKLRDNSHANKYLVLNLLQTTHHTWGGVDKRDQYTQYYVFNHKTLKWPKRIFFKMLEILKNNSFSLFLLSPNHQAASSKSLLTFLQFSLSVAMGHINGYTTRENPRGRPSTVPLEITLTQRHVLPADLVNKSWCHVCYARYASGKQEKKCQTRYGCSDCRKLFMSTKMFRHVPFC